MTGGHAAGQGRRGEQPSQFSSVNSHLLEVTDQACREEIIAILLGIEETRGNEGEYGPHRLFALSANTRP